MIISKDIVNQQIQDSVLRSDYYSFELHVSYRREDGLSFARYEALIRQPAMHNIL